MNSDEIKLICLDKCDHLDQALCSAFEVFLLERVEYAIPHC